MALEWVLEKIIMKTVGEYLNNDDQNKLRIGIRRGMYYYFLKAYFQTKDLIRISKKVHVNSTNEQSPKNPDSHLTITPYLDFVQLSQDETPPFNQLIQVTERLIRWVNDNISHFSRPFG